MNGLGWGALFGVILYLLGVWVWEWETCIDGVWNGLQCEQSIVQPSVCKLEI